MQGHKSFITTLPESLSFEHGSTSSEPVTESQISWNNIQTSPPNRLPDYRTSPNEANCQYLHPHGCQLLNVEWSSGETSSTTTHSEGENNERKREHAWSHCQTSNILPPDSNIDLNSNSTQAEFEDPEHDTCHIIGNSSDLPSESSEHIAGGVESGQGFSVDGRRMSGKRKSLEVHGGQSSGAGSSTRPMENEPGTNNNVPEQINSRLRLGTLLPESFSYSTRSESSRRNFRLRINGSQSRHQGHVLSDDPSSRELSSVSLRDRLLDLNPPPIAENNDQTGLLNPPSARRNTQSRWAAAGSSAASGERDPMLYDEFAPRNVVRSISEHPMFVPAPEIGSTSRVGPISGVNSSGPSWANRSRPQYSRRLSEIVRRSLLTSGGIESSGGGQSSRQAVQSGPSQISSGPSIHGRHLSGLRSGLSERQHVDSALELPHSLRSLAAGGEGRTSLMSEQIRHVLDLMRRGEGLRFEDVMVLDRSLFFGMSDIHDRHRDMRLDIDNMSYEELLALGERIGNVSTGINEETIMSRLKLTTNVNRAENQTETEPCSICREEYIDGEDLGTLDCGHEFHKMFARRPRRLQKTCAEVLDCIYARASSITRGGLCLVRGYNRGPPTTSCPFALAICSWVFVRTPWDIVGHIG
ncbi:RING/U-box superfamily protein [Striga hermonthica]|uniref:RING-type E3 ubiquitin transferase n=1 Tax=Striga hermonthica TaxID=68872 RepID=A0A9N7NXN5_STRHE|nr:RING/U-box superfamily protein [Striga hermonthica]